MLQAFPFAWRLQDSLAAATDARGAAATPATAAAPTPTCFKKSALWTPPFDEDGRTDMVNASDIEEMPRRLAATIER